MYNVTVEEYHTYYVLPAYGEAGIWAHNTTPCTVTAANQQAAPPLRTQGPNVQRSGTIIKVNLVGNGISGVGRPMTVEQARRFVRGGGDVYVANRAMARQIAGRNAVRAETDRRILPGEARFPHFHLANRPQGAGHVFFGRGRGR